MDIICLCHSQYTLAWGPVFSPGFCIGGGGGGGGRYITNMYMDIFYVFRHLRAEFTGLKSSKLGYSIALKWDSENTAWDRYMHQMILKKKILGYAECPGPPIQ